MGMLFVLVTFVTSLVHELGEDGRTSAELSSCFSCLSSYSHQGHVSAPLPGPVPGHSFWQHPGVPREAAPWDVAVSKEVNGETKPQPEPSSRPKDSHIPQSKGEPCSQPRTEHGAPSSWGCCRPPGLSPPPGGGCRDQGCPRSP